MEHKVVHLYRSSITILLLLVAIFAATGITAHAQSTGTSTWHIQRDYVEGCVESTGPADMQVWGFPVVLLGTWTHSITTGLSHLPQGATTWTETNPIPPGSGNGSEKAEVLVRIASGTNIGSYTLQNWATDGTTRQQSPVTLNVLANCRY